MKTVSASRLPKSPGECLAAACVGSASGPSFRLVREPRGCPEEEQSSPRGQQMRRPWGGSPAPPDTVPGCREAQGGRSGERRQDETSARPGGPHAGGRRDFSGIIVIFNTAADTAVAVDEALVVTVTLKEYRSCPVARSNFEIKSVSKTNSSEGRREIVRKGSAGQTRAFIYFYYYFLKWNSFFFFLIF